MRERGGASCHSYLLLATPGTTGKGTALVARFPWGGLGDQTSVPDNAPSPRTPIGSVAWGKGLSWWSTGLCGHTAGLHSHAHAMLEDTVTSTPLSGTLASRAITLAIADGRRRIVRPHGLGGGTAQEGLEGNETVVGGASCGSVGQCTTSGLFSPIVCVRHHVQDLDESLASWRERFEVRFRRCRLPLRPRTAPATSTRLPRLAV